jgi:hypothetical protein
MITHTIRSSFISEQKRGQEGKIAERKRESEGERASIVVSVVKRTVRKYTCLINEMVNILHNCYLLAR